MRITPEFYEESVRTVVNVNKIVYPPPELHPSDVPLLNIDEFGVLKTKASRVSDHIDYFFLYSLSIFPKNNQ